MGSLGVLFSRAQVTGDTMFERCDVTFESQGLRCAGWYYVPRDTKLQGPQPAIVMAHGFSAVKEMYLDNFAEQFAEAG